MDSAIYNRNSTIQNPKSENARLLTFASGGWVLVLTALATLGIFVWAVAPAIMRTINKLPGDGKTIESYAFNLTPLLVPQAEIVPAMQHRDMAPALINPTAHNAAETQRINDPKYGKYLVPTDRVIGVDINGQARAYPISVMYVHEIVNDTLAGVPVAVTYNWLCDSTVVFDRRVNGRTIDFRVSGLVYNSNLLMYDKQTAIGSDGKTIIGGESLWSQLQARAISGPAAQNNLTLEILPVAVLSWADWLTLHPDTTVVDRNLHLVERYKDAAPTAYFLSDRLLFPVNPKPPANGPDAKTPVIIVSSNIIRRVYTVPYLANRAFAAHESGSADSPGEWSDTLGSITLRFHCDRNSGAAWVSAPSSAKVEIIYAFWFAWHAMHPDDAPAGAVSSIAGDADH